MENLPQDNQHEQLEMQHPLLSLDLSGEQGNVFAVIGHAQQVVPADEQETFRQEIQAATAPGAGKKYDDILEIVNSHVELVDTSYSHPVYGNPEHVQDTTERYQRHVIGAVERLNDQMHTVPETTSIQIDGVYPEFDDEDYSPDKYMVVLNFEIGRVEGDIEHAVGAEREALEQYRAMLRECRSSLRRAGVL